MYWRKALLVGQGLTILAMVLVIASRTGDAPGNAPRLFGVDSLALGASVVLVVSTALVVYALRADG